MNERAAAYGSHFFLAFEVRNCLYSIIRVSEKKTGGKRGKNLFFVILVTGFEYNSLITD